MGLCPGTNATKPQRIARGKAARREVQEARRIKNEREQRAAIKISSMVRMMIVRANRTRIVEQREVDDIFADMPSAPPTRPGTRNGGTSEDAAAAAVAATPTERAAERLKRYQAKPERGRQDPFADVEIEVVDSVIEMIEELAGDDTLITEQAKLRRAMGFAAEGGGINL